jgi:hypothetical protein
MFLVSLVCLLGPASSVFSADLEVPWLPPGECYVVAGTEEYDEIDVSGCIIVPPGATLIVNEESTIDGNWHDGEGGDGATILVDGGTFIMRNRLNMGTDHDAYLIVDNGGTVIHTGEKVTIPDNDGGEHRLIVLDGEYTSEETQIIPQRDSAAIVGCFGKLTTCQIEEGTNNDPDWWRDNGALWCEQPCDQPVITDLGGDCKEVICWVPPCPPIMFPRNGATGIAAVTCDLILSWCGYACRWSYCIGQKGRYFIYFGDCNCVTNTPSPPAQGYNDPACYKGDNLAGNAFYNVGRLPLWTKYCWRIDLGCEDGSIHRSDVWTFATGCPLIDGDANLDCVVNFLDYAALASTWMDDQFFPSGCSP